MLIAKKDMKLAQGGLIHKLKKGEKISEYLNENLTDYAKNCLFKEAKAEEAKKTVETKK